MEKKTILLVDDNIDVLECISALLCRQGYHTAPFSESSAALSLVESDDALDLAIVDLVMPGMDGLEFLERTRQVRPGLPCIMITGYCSVEAYLKATSLGAIAYLNKPFGNRELGRIVSSVLQVSDPCAADGGQFEGRSGRAYYEQ